MAASIGRWAGRFRKSRPLVVVVAAAMLHGSAAIGSPPMQLQLGACQPTFDEEFDNLSVSAWGPGSRWIAHTPWNGDFGDAQFSDPIPGFPFATRNGTLAIEARKGADGLWRSGLLSSTDAAGAGFSQTYGYFEMRAKMPQGAGVWPAFWLVTAGHKGKPSIEIDVVEYYGHVVNKYFVTTHVWYDNDKLTRSYEARVPVESGSLSGRFHTYGVLVDRHVIAYFFDRREVVRQRTPVEHTRPLGILVDLALGGGWPIDQTPNPSRLLVDYIRAYPSADVCARGR